jgi:hypothetical protein
MGMGWRDVVFSADFASMAAQLTPLTIIEQKTELQE